MLSVSCCCVGWAGVLDLDLRIGRRCHTGRMQLARSAERVIERLIDRVAGLIFPGQLQPAELTARIVRWSDGLLAGLAAAYAVQLVAVVATSGERPDFNDVAKLRESLAKPDGFLVGWTHFLAFDLFVGRWIWQTAVREERSARLALVMTLMAGPAGLGIFGLQRRSLRP